MKGLIRIIIPILIILLTIGDTSAQVVNIRPGAGKSKVNVTNKKKSKTNKGGKTSKPGKSGKTGNTSKRKTKGSQGVRESIEVTEIEIVEDSVAVEDISDIKEYLKDYAESWNEICPQDQGDGTILSGVTYSSTQNLLELQYIVTEQVPDFNAIKTALLSDQSKEVAAESIMVPESDNDFDFCYYMFMGDANVAFDYYFTQNKQHVNVYIPSEKLAEAYGQYLQGTVVANNNNSVDNYNQYAQLDETINSIQQGMLPMQVDEYTRWVEFSRTGSNVIYVYTIDENSIPMSSFKTVKQIQRQELEKNLGSDSTFEWLKLLVNAKVYLTYRYKGDKYGEACDIVFTPEELSRIYNNH
ncbi:MAG: hypothetical protein NC201_02450 [Prevotella sp.]|nr:hypothetical protein [Bacteroides sp.]MCM1366087.1 hypothetical protein [Prevotella sp.]MCM1436572.1 hypothetical protein [Prevotella sp.]